MSSASISCCQQQQEQQQQRSRQLGVGFARGNADKYYERRPSSNRAAG